MTNETSSLVIAKEETRKQVC